MNRVKSRNDFGHDDSTINIVMAIIIIIIRTAHLPIKLDCYSHWNFKASVKYTMTRAVICKIILKICQMRSYLADISVFLCRQLKYFIVNLT